MGHECYWFKDSIKTSVESNYWFLSEVGSNLVCFYRQHFYRTFQCMEKSTERIFFIKIILKLVLDPQNKMEVGKFLILDHPNLIKIKEIYESEENIYVVTELHSMNILDNFIEKKVFSERDVARAMRSVLSALVYLHQKNIFHRCINPESIVVVIENGELVVKLDNCFMGSLITDEVHNSFFASNLVFAAPEMLRSRKEEFAADLWAVGVVVYFLLSGELPFSSHNPRHTLTMQFAQKVQLNKIAKLSLTTRDFVEHLVHPDPKKRMTAMQAYLHPWINYDLNSMVPLEGLAEKLEKYRKLRRIRVKMEVVNSATYDNLVSKCKEHGGSGCVAPSSVCGSRVVEKATVRPVIVTNESDFYFRFGPTANRDKPIMDLDSTNVCRLLRCMYRQQEVTLYEEAVRCQSYYKSIFDYNAYVPPIWTFLRIANVQDYLDWWDKMLQMKSEYLNLKKPTKYVNKFISFGQPGKEEQDEEEEEEEDELDLDYELSSKLSELLEKSKSSKSFSDMQKFSHISDRMEDNRELLKTMSVAVPESRIMIVPANSVVEMKSNAKELQRYEHFESLFEALHGKPKMDLTPLCNIKKSVEYEPDSQILYELRSRKPKKREIKRNIQMDFTYMINNPYLFQDFYEFAPNEIEKNAEDIIDSTRHIYKLYTYRPSFHPAQLGIDQFTVDQNPDGYGLNNDVDPKRQETRYAHCRAGVVTKRVIPPWMEDVNDPTPLLIPHSQYQLWMSRGIKPPHTCHSIPPDPLPVEHLTIYDLIEDPMLSRFNAFQHPHVKNSTPPRIQTTERFLPFPEKPLKYRDRHCPGGDNLLKKCPYKKMLENKIGKLSRQTRDSDGTAEREKADGFELDGGSICDQMLNENKPSDSSEKEESEGECAYLTGRPCLMQAFDAHDKVCYVSRDGNRRLCCDNLYQLWGRADRVNESILRESNYKSSIGPKAKMIEVATNRRQGSIGNVVANITEDPRVVVQPEPETKEVRISANMIFKSELQRQLLLLRDAQQERHHEASCKNVYWSPFEFEETGELPSAWSSTLLM